MVPAALQKFNFPVAIWDWRN